MLKRVIFLLVFFTANILLCQYDAAIKSYVPTTPTAAAFAKVAEVPVNKFSGSSSISIPLYEIMDNQLKSGISLGYSTAGIKAGELASQVGLGWNLNAGGAITRSVRGLPDERLKEGQLSGYYLDGYDPLWYQNPATAIEVEAGKRDIEADIFFYNFDGYSGSFQFNQYGRIVQKSKTELKIIPIMTGYSYNRLLWKIITPDGNIYYFGDTSIDDVYDDAVSYTNQYSHLVNSIGILAPTSLPSVDAWYLVKVETWDATSSISYEYNEYELYSFRDIASSVSQTLDSIGRNFISSNGIASPPQYNYANLNDINRVIVTEALSPRLTKIITNKGSYALEYSTQTRQDLDTVVTAGYHPAAVIGMPPVKVKKPQALKSIKYFGKLNSLINQYDLNTSYYTSPSNGFTETLGLLPLTDINGSYFSDMRRLRLDAVKSIANGSVINEHLLTYNENSIQRRWSYAVDEHGYPNGKLVNKNLFPRIKIDTAVNQLPPVDLSALTILDLADRSPDEDVAKKPMLSKITYPTGGSTSLLYEGHSYHTSEIQEVPLSLVDLRFDNCSSPATQCSTCCIGPKKTSDSVMLNLGNPLYRYEMMIEARRTADDVSTLPIDVLVRMRAATNNMMPFRNIVLNAGNQYKYQECVILTTNLFIPPTTNGYYQFEMEVYGGRRVFVNLVVKQFSRTAVAVNKPIGGLRIKTITHDAIIGPSITKSYEYKKQEGSNESSGYLVALPNYVMKLPSDAAYSYGVLKPGFSGLTNLDYNWTCYNIGYYLNTGNIYPLSSIQGSHIGYARVTERVSNDQGYTVSIFFIDPAYQPKRLVSYLDPPYIYMDPRAGMLSEEAHYNSAGTLIQRVNNTYAKTSWSALQASSQIQEIVPFCPNSLNYFVKNYNTPSEFAYLSNTISLKDGVTTTSSMEYGLLADTLTMMTAQEVTNSDGKVHRTEYSYTNSYNINLDVKNALLIQNRLLPAWQMMKKVDGNIVDGTRLLYAYRASDGTMLDPEVAGSGGIYAARQDRREVTWTGGSRIDNQWQPDVSFKRYFIPMGKPDLLNVDGWPIDHSFQYSLTGKLLNYTYNGFTSSYAYHSNTDELITKTNVDGTYQTFDYDGLLRLKTTTMQPQGVVTRFEYQYAQPSLITNSIKQAMVYPVTAGSGLDSVVNITHSDGLGRELQRIHKYGAPNYDDVLIRTSYDAVGRPIQQYTPQAVASNHGSYVSTTPTTAAAVTSYYADPLSRAETITPPAWYPSSTVYGNNTTPITSPDGIVYPIASLYKMMSIDADGKKTIIYTDKVGRVVSQIKASANEAESVATWTFYDDKNRPTVIVPPGATLSTPNLLFENRYDTEDNLIYKKVPDATAEQYVYNERNLLIGMRNGILTTQGRWLVTHYDAFGRPTKRGYHNLSGTLPSTDNPVINTLLEENFYDGYNGSSTITSHIYKNKLRKQRTKALEDNGVNNLWIESELTYDAYGRVISTSGINHRGQAETTSTSYDFADNVITTTQTISGPQGITQQMDYTYDHQGRKIDESISINGGPPKTLSNSVHNHRNEIIERNIGKTGVAGPMAYLQSVDYTYNVQGWLTGINELPTFVLTSAYDPCNTTISTSRSGAQLNSNNLDDYDIFYQKLNYDTNITGTLINKNGNISSQVWMHSGTNLVNQTYTYQYDFLNRVKQSVHGELNNNIATQKNNYNEDFSYDQRGNITKLNRKGMVQQLHLSDQCYQSSTIDSLDYTYAPNSNKLTQVTDKAPCQDVLTIPDTIKRDIIYAANQTIIANHTLVQPNVIMELIANNIKIIDSLKVPKSNGLVAYITAKKLPCPDIKYSEGFSQQSNGNYLYDDSGNMTYDPNKKVTFKYNYLNLAYQIIGAENDTIYNLYGSDGTLLQRKYSITGITQFTRDYIDNVEYLNNSIEAVELDDTRLINDNGNYVFEYKLKDHLGNVRTTFIDSNNDGRIQNDEVTQRRDYYAFGLDHDGNYKTTVPNPLSKNRHGFNGKETWKEMNLGLSDFHARMMDPALGRFLQIDELSSKFYSWSGYHFVNNNPIIITDPDGRDTLPLNSVITPLPRVNPGPVIHPPGTKIPPVSIISTGVQKLLGFVSYFLDPANGNIGPNQTLPLNSNIERFTTDPSSLSDSYLQEANERILSGNGTPQDFLYSIEYKKRFKGPLALPVGNPHKHHVLPQSFRSWFKQRGIPNIDDYTVVIDGGFHLKAIHGRGGGPQNPGKWNSQWTNFIKNNPNATPSQIFHFAEGLLKRNNLDHLKYVPYK
jgi:RHS repeat-associated protein